MYDAVWFYSSCIHSKEMHPSFCSCILSCQFVVLYFYVKEVLMIFISMIKLVLQGPVNYICLHCVKPNLRPLSVAISTVSIHIFGDVPSSPLVGLLQVRFFSFSFSFIWLFGFLFYTTVTSSMLSIWIKYI